MTDSITYVYNLKRNTLKLIYLPRDERCVGMRDIEIRNAVWQRRGRKARRVKESRFRKSFTAETQEGRRSMVRRSSSTYNGEVSASSGMRGSKSKRDEGAIFRCARQGGNESRWNGARARDHESIAALSGNCAMACQRGCFNGNDANTDTGVNASDFAGSKKKPVCTPRFPDTKTHGFVGLSRPR